VAASGVRGIYAFAAMHLMCSSRISWNYTHCNEFRTRNGWKRPASPIAGHGWLAADPYAGAAELGHDSETPARINFLSRVIHLLFRCRFVYEKANYDDRYLRNLCSGCGGALRTSPYFGQTSTPATIITYAGNDAIFAGAASPPPRPNW